MIERVVPYEISKTLSDLGFKDKCVGYYNFAGWYSPSEIPSNPDTYSCEAPVWEQVKEWFLDKHDIYVNLVQKGDKFVVNLKEFDSYRDARLEALIVAINRLKYKLECQ